MKKVCADGDFTVSQSHATFLSPSLLVPYTVDGMVRVLWIKMTAWSLIVTLYNNVRCSDEKVAMKIFILVLHVCGLYCCVRLLPFIYHDHLLMAKAMCCLMLSAPVHHNYVQLWLPTVS